MGRLLAQRVSASSTLSEASTVLPTPQAPASANGNPKADSEVPSVVPPTHRSRTLVLCFDGTGDQSVAVTFELIYLHSTFHLLHSRFDDDVSVASIQGFLTLT